MSGVASDESHVTIPPHPAFAANADWLRSIEAALPIEGAHVRIEALAASHRDGLSEVGLEPEVWRWTQALLRTREDLGAYIDVALRSRAEGHAFPFVILERASGREVGSTRFGNIAAEHRRLEIGWTWVAPPWQRTAVNTETKFLLLRLAFERLGAGRVEFKTDALNERSRAALLRIGAREEGTLRAHMITDTGRVRDSVYFSIVAAEWPQVRAALEAGMRKM